MEPKTELQKNAIVTAQRKELETYQRALDIQCLNSRVEASQMSRSLALIKKETEMEKDFMERRDHAAIVNARAEKEIALGIEIAKKTREDVCQLLRRHYLRERDPQLRELAKKLQGAYVRKDLEQQILQNQYKRLQDKAEEANANRILHDAFNDKISSEEDRKKEMEKRRQYFYELQQQLVNKQQQKHCEYEDTLIEKKMLDDIFRTLADEDQRELKQKQDQTEKTRREMVTFQEARKAWKEKQRQMVILEERKIQEQMVAAADRSSAILQERERKFQMKEEVNKRIVAKMAADKAAREERDNIIKQLQEQEYLEKNVQDDIKEKHQQDSKKKDTRTALVAQMNNRKKVAEEQRARDERYREQVLAKIAADDEKEKIKENKKKEAARKFAVDLKKQINDNEKRRRADRRMEEMRNESVWTYQDNWDDEARVEQQKMIREHASALYGEERE